MASLQAVLLRLEPPRPACTRHQHHALPKSVKLWSLTTMRQKLIKIGAKVVVHTRYVSFQMGEMAVLKHLFRSILERIRRLRPPETVLR